MPILWTGIVAATCLVALVGCAAVSRNAQHVESIDVENIYELAIDPDEGGPLRGEEFRATGFVAVPNAWYVSGSTAPASASLGLSMRTGADDGKIWRPISPGQTPSLRSLAASSDELIYGVCGQTVQRSVDGGVTGTLASKFDSRDLFVALSALHTIVPPSTDNGSQERTAVAEQPTPTAGVATATAVHLDCGGACDAEHIPFSSACVDYLLQSCPLLNIGHKDGPSTQLSAPNGAAEQSLSRLATDYQPERSLESLSVRRV